TEGGKHAIRNDRLIAVPRDSHRDRAAHDARDLPKQVRSEIEKFFVATDELEDKELKFLGWKGRKTGKRLIEKAVKRFKKSQRQKASGGMMTLRMSAWWSPLQETGIDGWNIRTHVWEQRLRTIRFLARPTDRHRDYDRGVGVRGRGRSDPSG